MADRVVIFLNANGARQGVKSDESILVGGIKRGAAQMLVNGSNGIDLIASGIIGMVATTINEDATNINLTGSAAVNLGGGSVVVVPKLTTTANGTHAAVLVGSVAGDPSTLVNGDVWYNSTIGKFRKREGGISSNFVSSNSATFVVHPTPGVGDYTTIQDALNNLPADGGLIIVREGTYNISTTITLPNKPVIIMGCGVESTIVNLGSNAIYAFTASFVGTQFQEQGFYNFTIQGDGTLGQKGFFLDDSSFNTQFQLQHFYVNNIDAIVHDENSSGVDFDFADGVLADRVGVLHYECPTPGNGTLWIANCRWENVNGAIKRGGISGKPFVNISNSRLDSGTTMDLGRAQVTGSRFAADGAPNKKVSMGDIRGAEMSSCEFRGAAYLEFTTGPCAAVGNIFRDTPTRAIDVLAAITSGTISGNVFTWATEAVRVAGSGLIVSGNQNNKVTETGAADNNRYTDITSTSTILGVSSTVEGAKRFDITGVTTAAFVTVFTHVNPKGLVGIGTIKNTDGVDSLDVRETVIDSFGNTVQTVTTVVAGDTYMLDPQTDFSTTCFPPYVSYKVEVMDTSAGNHATFELHQTSQGAL